MGLHQIVYVSTACRPLSITELIRQRAFGSFSMGFRWLEPNLLPENPADIAIINNGFDKQGLRDTPSESLRLLHVYASPLHAR